MNTKKIAVYGTLKKGHGNHSFFIGKEVEPIGTHAVKGAMFVKRGYGYPHMYRQGAVAQGAHDMEYTTEVYEVPVHAYNRICAMERGAGYDDVEIDTAHGAATIFYAHPDIYEVSDKHITQF